MDIDIDIFSKCYNNPLMEEALKAKKEGYYPYFIPIQTAQKPVVKINGRKVVVACSNNYLGLTTDRRVKQAAIKAIKKYGTGCTGSRFLSGTLEWHEEVEKKFANFMNLDSAILFTTGHHTNLGAIQAIVQKGEIIITDKLDHASIIDGCRLSYGEMVRFRHNDMDDLERVLKKYAQYPKLIIVDGVFSMEGDLANLPAIIELAKIYKARLMVDDAHGFGIFGKNGRGTPEHFNVEKDVDIFMTTASKSLASIGGFLAAEEKVIHYIKHNARSLIFTASLPPAQLAAIDKSLDIIKDEPERRERLWKIVTRVKKGLQELGYDTRKSESAIIPVTIGDWRLTIAFWKALFDFGVFTSPVLPPAVPEGQALIRTSYMSTHSDKEIDFILAGFEYIGQRMGIIPARKFKPIKKHPKFLHRLKIGFKYWIKSIFR